MISAAASNLNATVSSSEQIQIQRQKTSSALTQRSRQHDLFSVTISYKRQRRQAYAAAPHSARSQRLRFQLHRHADLNSMPAGF